MDLDQTQPYNSNWDSEELIYNEQHIIANDDHEKFITEQNLAKKRAKKELAKGNPTHIKGWNCICGVSMYKYFGMPTFPTVINCSNCNIYLNS